MQKVRRTIMTSRAGSLTLSRRNAVVLGAGAAAGAPPGLFSRPAGAFLKLDVTQGTIQPIPIAVPEFVAVATTDPAIGRNISEIIGSNLGWLRLFGAIDSGGVLETITHTGDRP